MEANGIEGIESEYPVRVVEGLDESFMKNNEDKINEIELSREAKERVRKLMEDLNEYSKPDVSFIEEGTFLVIEGEE